MTHTSDDDLLLLWKLSADLLNADPQQSLKHRRFECRCTNQERANQLKTLLNDINAHQQRRAALLFTTADPYPYILALQPDSFLTEPANEYECFWTGYASRLQTVSFQLQYPLPLAALRWILATATKNFPAATLRLVHDPENYLGDAKEALTAARDIARHPLTDALIPRTVTRLDYDEYSDAKGLEPGHGFLIGMFPAQLGFEPGAAVAAAPQTKRIKTA